VSLDRLTSARLDSNLPNDIGQKDISSTNPINMTLGRLGKSKRTIY